MNNVDLLFINQDAGLSYVIVMKPNKIALEFIEKDFAHCANSFPNWKLPSAVYVNNSIMFDSQDKKQKLSTLIKQL